MFVEISLRFGVKLTRRRWSEFNCAEKLPLETAAA